MGYGSVSQCFLPLLLRHVSMPRDRITVIDMVDCSASPVLAPALQEGVHFVQEQITRDKLGEQLSCYAGPGDMIIDLAWNIGCLDILEWCHTHDVLYINTSIELWDPYDNFDKKLTTDRTLYVRHMAIRKMIRDWGDKPGPTAIIEHGANPGLVSHFTKRALLDIGNKLKAEKKKDPRLPAIEQAMADGAYNRLAQLLQVKVIHISEIDTQITNQPHNPDEFVNTWSVEGFFEEGTAPAEMGWGTHERILPPDARIHTSGPRNQICLARFGINTFVRSRVPSQEIVGMVVRHGEAFTISDHLTVWDENGSPVYRPTVHYAYWPCAAAIASLHALRARHYKAHEKYRIMNDDIVSGVDELGCLLMGHDFKSWWAGTILSIEETRQLAPGQNATTLQVAASVLGAVFWMIHNPRRGVLVPDQLPHEEIMQVADPYLGEVVSMPLDWTPHGSDVVAKKTNNVFSPADDDPWQFQHFLL
ncbi:MAG: saccharopine dehydrogenase C-terminal domain-containing protein [Candidatus Peregrinibacteria bacterium]